MADSLSFAILGIGADKPPVEPSTDLTPIIVGVGALAALGIAYVASKKGKKT